MASELAKQLLDAGFPAAKPGRDNELLGIPTLEELMTAVEQFHPGFRLSVKRINPDEWEAHSGFISIDGEVAYWARHGPTATEALGKKRVLTFLLMLTASLSGRDPKLTLPEHLPVRATTEIVG